MNIRAIILLHMLDQICYNRAVVCAGALLAVNDLLCGLTFKKTVAGWIGNAKSVSGLWFWYDAPSFEILTASNSQKKVIMDQLYYCVNGVECLTMYLNIENITVVLDVDNGNRCKLDATQ